MTENPRHWARMPKLRLTPETRALRIPRAQCAYGVYAPVAYIRRRGDEVFLLRYPVFDVEQDGAYLFMFDDLLFALPPGRYAVEVWQGDKPNKDDCSTGSVCAEFELSLSGPCTLDVNLIEAVVSKRPIIRKGNMDVPNPIFDPIKDFSAELCDVLEASSTTLPLKTADRNAMCAMVLCRSVEMKICDGVRFETVRFLGCDAGVPQFTRGIDGDGAFRFPKGAVLTFDWTENNITAAVEGC